MPYSFRFSSNEPYRYRTGALWLGVDPEQAFEVGIETERHAITIAGAGAGKGAAGMIPNLKRWPHNALVIDPKGEAAEHTAEDRERMGQAVHVLDPFNVAPVPERFKARFNPLRNITRAQLDAREDVGVIADGLVMRHDPRASHWDGGGLSVLSGLIAYILDQAQPEKRTLPEVRETLTLPPDRFARVVAEMSTNGAFGNLPISAASKLTKSGNEAGHFLSVADENTKWLDSPAVAALLSDSTFDLADLKTKPCTVYLVLPAHLLGEHGRFLRLFVRMALNAMAKGGTRGGRRCLFMLDEFYSLGHIDEIAKAAGLMRGYGVQLWPILQDLGQLESLYGRDGAQTFFGNADAHIFFGNTDGLTLDHVSRRIGEVRADEVSAAPEARPFDYWGSKEMGGSEEERRERHRVDEENRMRAHHYEAAGVGRSRLPPDEVRDTVAKRAGDKVARSMIVFAHGRDVLNVKLWPYFQPRPEAQAPVPAPPTTPQAAPPSGPSPLLQALLLIWLAAAAVYCCWVYTLPRGGGGIAAISFALFGGLPIFLLLYTRKRA